MRIPRLVAAAGLAVAGDLPVDGLKALADPGGNVLGRLPAGQAVRDLDPVVLAQVPAADRRLDEAHAASVDEPQRSAAQRHADSRGGLRTRQPRPDQLEVPPLNSSGILFEANLGTKSPRPRFATLAGNQA
jgi:hypothetical protein